LESVFHRNVEDAFLFSAGREGREGVVFRMAKAKQLDLIECYRLAWKSFAKWWIPLCLISAGILVFKLGPKLVTSGSQKRMMAGAIAVFRATLEGDTFAAENHSFQLRKDVKTFVRDLLRVTGAALPFVAILWSVLLLYANRAVKDHKKKQPVLRVLLVAIWRLALAALKLLPLLVAVAIISLLAARGKPVPWLHWYHAVLILLFVFVISTVWFCYTYVKLLFVPLIMFDGETGGRAACRGSWRQTQGYFGVLLLVCFLNGFVQAALAVTVIGAIPGLSFVETVRAAAFRMTLPAGEEDVEAELADTEGPPSPEGDAS
jgi:hypothetical protein